MPLISDQATKPNGLPSQPLHHKSSSLTIEEQEAQYEEARVTFDKTIRGHYRDGKAGYAHVGVLFITWAVDDLQCNTKEVEALKRIFEENFCFETEIFQIPSYQCSSTLMAKVATFCNKYDNPDCLSIIYYGGHGYPGQETGLFKLAAKVKADADGDPRAFFNNIEACLRNPDCDQLLILDCCFSARAFSQGHIGKRKSELLVSAAHGNMSDAPGLPGSFTGRLNEVLQKLLEKHPRGFSTSQLFRDIYHRMPDEKKPQHFDQSRQSYGKIWLRPQVQLAKAGNDKGEPIYLNLDLKLNKSPEGAIMNELASHLQFLPHVDEIKVKQLWAPQREITNFMRSILILQKFRPLVKRLQDRRFMQKRKFPFNFESEDVPESVNKLRKQSSQKRESLFDWSSARVHNRRKSSTWPPVPVKEGRESAEVDRSR